MKDLLFCFLSFTTLFTKIFAEKECVINLTLQKSNPPFVLLKKTGTIVRPMGENLLRIGHDKEVIFDCHGSKIKQSVLSLHNKITRIEAICSDGKFYRDGKIITPEKLYCHPDILPAITKAQKICSPVGVDGRKTKLQDLFQVEIGFNFTGKFHKLITLCHDEKNYGTIWSSHEILGKSIQFRDKTQGRPAFRTNLSRQKVFYKFATATEVRRAYKKKSQIEMMKLTLHTNNKIVVDGHKISIINSSSSSSDYFARGHISPDADFIHSAEQDATYFFVNIAPQFQCFNNENWKRIESDSRNWAEDHKRALRIYSGTYKTLQYPNLEKEPTDIFLFYQLKYIPAPQFMWKVLYDAQTHSAIAFIGANNPYLRKVPSHLCKSVCKQTIFEDEDFYKFDSGYTLCCHVEELRKSVASVPDLTKGGKPPHLLGETNSEKPSNEEKPTNEEKPMKEQNSNDCEIDLDKSHEKKPPLITSRGSFIYPTYSNEMGHRIIRVRDDSHVDFSCYSPSKKNFLLVGSEKTSKIHSLRLTCLKRKFYHESKLISNIQTFHCSRTNEPHIVKEPMTDAPPSKHKNVFQVKIGWNVGNTYIHQMDVIIEEERFSTLQTKHRVEGSSIALRDKDPRRPPFRSDVRGKKRFFMKASSSKLNKAYSKKSQFKSVKKITGHTTIHGKLIIDTSPSSNFYFAKGHLSPDADFIYNVEQDATYYFINVASQFQSINNGNWKALEYATRDYAEKMNHTITVYTGTYEDLTYYKKVIYLLKLKYIPAPLYYWKVIHNEKTKEGIAFVGSNDPHALKPPKPLCKDVCDKIPWVDWDRHSIEKGIMYCCEVEDLRKSIPFVPMLNVKLLK